MLSHLVRRNNFNDPFAKQVAKLEWGQPQQPHPFSELYFSRSTNLQLKVPFNTPPTSHAI